MYPETEEPYNYVSVFAPPSKPIGSESLFWVNLYENGSASWYRTEDEARASIFRNHKHIGLFRIENGTATYISRQKPETE